MYIHSIFSIYVITICTIAVYMFFEARENDFDFGFIRQDLSAWKPNVLSKMEVSNLSPKAIFQLGRYSLIINTFQYPVGYDSCKISLAVAPIFSLGIQIWDLRWYEKGSFWYSRFTRSLFFRLKRTQCRLLPRHGTTSWHLNRQLWWIPYGLEKATHMWIILYSMCTFFEYPYDIPPCKLCHQNGRSRTTILSRIVFSPVPC